MSEKNNNGESRNISFTTNTVTDGINETSEYELSNQSCHIFTTDMSAKPSNERMKKQSSLIIYGCLKLESHNTESTNSSTEKQNQIPVNDDVRVTKHLTDGTYFNSSNFKNNAENSSLHAEVTE